MDLYLSAQRAVDGDYMAYARLVDDEGRVHMNPEMAKRIHFVEKPQQVILSEPLS